MTDQLSHLAEKAVEELERLAKAAPASSQPWKVYHKPLRPHLSKAKIIEVQTRNGVSLLPWTGWDQSNLPKNKKLALAQYIAAANPQAILALIKEKREMEERKDAAYLERNQVVAALAKCFPSGVARTAIDGWSDDWHGCVYIDIPNGQVSWHFHDSHAHLFDGLPPYKGGWDGHSTEEKYQRLAALTPPSPGEST